MVGILLSRPLASLVADIWELAQLLRGQRRGTRPADCRSCAAIAGAPAAGSTGYVALIASLWQLLRDEPVLRVRAFTAALVMASFGLFWTAVALRLAQSPFSLDQAGVAIFALVGAGGAAATSPFGRMGDRGWTRVATTVSHLILLGAMALSAWAGEAETGHSVISLVLLGAGAADA